MHNLASQEPHVSITIIIPYLAYYHQQKFPISESQTITLEFKQPTSAKQELKPLSLVIPVNTIYHTVLLTLMQTQIQFSISHNKNYCYSYLFCLQICCCFEL